MQVALIAPWELLYYQRKTHYQLMLPQLLTNPEYCDAYDEFTARGDYVIMDNGAAEGKAFADDYLLGQATLFKVSELAIPDVLGDTEETYARMEMFLAHVQQNLGSPFPFKFGLVAQGRDRREALDLVYKVVGSRWVDDIKTIFIPRLLVSEDDRFVRINIAEELWDEFGDRFDLHMFGSSPVWPREILAIQAEAPFVRGIDTSLPFNMTHKKLSVMNGGNSTRPSDYFDLEAEEFDPVLLDRNVGTYLSWARYVD